LPPRNFALNTFLLDIEDARMNRILIGTAILIVIGWGAVGFVAFGHGF
jgi:hypothetical protein